METITTSIQDYLKTIYDLTSAGKPASTTELAQRLGIAPASVTGMLQKLAAVKPPLIAYKKHRGVTLTHAGKRAALEVIRHHRLLETYLVQTLGYSWDTVHDEACKLEHVISEEFETKIAEMLGNPDRDPHGDPIPDRDLKLSSDASIPISDLRPGQSAVITRVRSDDANFLRHAEAIGLIPQKRITIKDYSPIDKNTRIQIGKKLMVVGFPITQNIFVEVEG
jgi:DtxR family Mn-dependent transcriptional regulator